MAGRSALLQSAGFGCAGLSVAGAVPLCPACSCYWSSANCTVLPWAVGSTALAWKVVISWSSGEGGKAQAVLICGQEEKLYDKGLFYKISKPVADVGAEHQ